MSVAVRTYRPGENDGKEPHVPPRDRLTWAMARSLGRTPFRISGTPISVSEKHPACRTSAWRSGQGHAKSGAFSGVTPPVAALPHTHPQRLVAKSLRSAPKTRTSDTHGQSAAVFRLAYVLVIELMPRIRRWRQLRLYRAERESGYRHIDPMFSGAVNCALIRRHYLQCMQLAPAIPWHSAGMDCFEPTTPQIRRKRSSTMNPWRTRSH